MSDLTVTIPHQLGRDEARRRIREQLSQIRSQAASYGTFEERWPNDDAMEFTAAAMGQQFNGRLVIEDRQVCLTVALPWMLSMLGGVLRTRIEDQGRKLLSGPCGS